MKHAWGIFLSLVFCAVSIGAAANAQSSTPSTSPANHKAVVIVISGEINDYTRDTLEKRLGHARQLGADTVILQLDTYGGAVTSGLEMSALIKRTSNLHVIAFVPEKAISAGAMIALACDEIVMAPAAKLGDSAPISISTDGSLQPLPETERAKIESPILQDFRDSAQRNGYDPLLAEAMVSVGRSVYWIEDSAGHRRFVQQDEYSKLTQGDQWHAVPNAPNPIDTPSELLTVGTNLAIQLGLSKGSAPTAEALAESRGLTIVATLAASTGEEFLRLFSTAPVRFLLFVVFIMSLYIALHIPGQGAPEAIALISLALLLGVPWLTGYAQWWEIVLIIAGLSLLAFEIFVIPGHGFAALPGIGLMLFGFLMTFVPKEPNGLPGFLPSLPATWKALENGLIVIVSGMGCSMLLGTWLRRYLPRLPFFNRLILTTTVGGVTTKAAPGESGAWPQLGDKGRTTSDLRPGGSAMFFDSAAGDQRLFSVVSDRGFVAINTDVIVQEVGGGRLVVRPVS